MQFGQKLTHQKSINRAMATGDIEVIDLLVHDATHTQHETRGRVPSSLVLCMHHITHLEGYNYYIQHCVILSADQRLKCTYYT